MRTKFHDLLNVLNINDLQEDIVNKTKITNVLINKNEKRWDIHFLMPFPMQAEKMYNFIYRLINELPNKYIVDKIDYKINYEHRLIDQDFIIDTYWNYVIDLLQSRYPRFKMLKNYQYLVEEDKIKILVSDFADKMLLENQYKGQVEYYFQRLGFDILFEAILDENGNSALDSVEKFSEEVKQMHMPLEPKEHKIEDKAPEKPQTSNHNKYPSKPMNVVDGIIGREIKTKTEPINTIPVEQYHLTDNDNFVVEGVIFNVSTRELKNGTMLLYEVKMTDYNDSIVVKYFLRDIKVRDNVDSILKKNNRIKVKGRAQYDTYSRDVVLMANSFNLIGEEKKKVRNDEGLNGEKRVELHLHSKMSVMDGVASIKDYVGQALKWGHKAIALTDHNNVHSIPELFHSTRGKDIKPIYGVEANIVDDNVLITWNDKHWLLDDCTYIVYDLETTGFSVNDDEIIEIAAVKIKHGEIIDEYSTFINPCRPLSLKTINITNITDDMVRNAPKLENKIQEIKEWFDGSVLVAHNASFDIGHLDNAYRKYGLGKLENPVIDTLQIARTMYNDKLKRFNLKAVAKLFKVELTMHHRAINDAKATAEAFLYMLKDIMGKGVKYLDDINSLIDRQESFKYPIGTHGVLLAKNQAGLKNMFKLVSLANTINLHKEPRFIKARIEEYREGILIGSGCVNGEVFRAALEKTYDDLLEKASFYDYLEVQPPSVYNHLRYTTGQEDNDVRVKNAIKLIIKAGNELGKPVVATSDAHHLDPEDRIYREIYTVTPSIGGGLHPLGNRDIEEIPSQHFFTTHEMLREFDFLGNELAKEIVITNPNKIADSIEIIDALKDELFTPTDDFLVDKGIDSINDELEKMCIDTAHNLYGDILPKYVEDRLNKELNSIITHGFGVVYYISHMLVKKSLDDGFIVGSRGSVGSSFVATLMDITEVNPLPPHYRCPSCKFSAFKMNDEEKQKYEISNEAKALEKILGSSDSGYDLPDQKCPICGEALTKDGHDIPFETFLGFKGDKVPDIDLNFSGEYQPTAHNYCKEVFGEEYVYRAGTISTVAEKTAFGYVRGYFEKKGTLKRNVEIERLASKCEGIKRTTGQHPGGIIVVPRYMDIYDISPVQFPADDVNSEWRTTHFDFHSIHDNLLKLDILGHDDPTVLRYLQDITGIAPKDVPLDDKEVYKLFYSTESLNITPEQINSTVGSYGVPEFGTNFVRQMLVDTRPDTFAELVKISGLSHGTDVWLNNAQQLVADKKCDFKEVIGCRDDIMVYLMYQGLEPSVAFNIMEFVRRGKPSKEKEQWEKYIEIMKANNVPEWYIWSCGQIKYMFPKAHATAYVLMAIRIAWFKVNMPIYYYAAYFSKRASFFDVEVMARGYEAIKGKLREIDEKGNEATSAEKNLYTVLEIALEMTARGFSFKQVDIRTSNAQNFLISEDEKSLLIPFIALDGLGGNVANSIVNARNDKNFVSIADLSERTQVSKTLIERLSYLGSLGDLPQTNQMSLF